MRRILLIAAAFACLAPAGQASAAVRTFPGCKGKATLAACINSAPAGTTIRLRTNALIPIPNMFEIHKGLNLVAAKGFHPKIGRTGAATKLFFLPPAKGNVTITGIAFRQVGVVLAFETGRNHRVTLERNVVTVDTGSNGDEGFGSYTNNGARASFVIRNNTVSASGTSIDLSVQGGPVTVVGNRVTTPVGEDSQTGIAVTAIGSGTVKAMIASNLIHHVTGCNCGHAAALDADARDTATLDVRILNNTIDELLVPPLDQAFGIAIQEPDAAAKINARIYNNSVTNTHATGILIDAGPPAVTVTGDHNNSFGNLQDELGTFSLGTMLAVDPLFISGYQLAATSPLKDAGETCIAGLPLPRADARNRFRVAGAAVDIGAYERGSTAKGSVKGVSKSGTNGANNLVGTSGRDVLCGLGGKDLLAGLGGGDFLFGGLGPDKAFGGAGSDRLDLRDGVAGNDWAYGEAGSDVCLADAGDHKVSC